MRDMIPSTRLQLIFVAALVGLVASAGSSLGTNSGARGVEGPIFSDGFESGSVWDWSNVSPSARPPEVCARPADLLDVSMPDVVVGNGTPASCTEQALVDAMAVAGTVIFDCGGTPHTIAMTSEIEVVQDTVLDGGGLVTLDGGNTTRFLSLASSFELDTPHLVIQRMAFRNGRSFGPGGQTEIGGGAIYRLGGRLTIIDSDFVGNRAPGTGPDVGGGAVYSVGGGATVIVGTLFQGNQASNGGALGNLHNDLTVANSVLRDGFATGSGGNPGDGGSGGAIYIDGINQDVSLCGVRLTGNQANAHGGALFRVSNNLVGSMVIDRSLISENTMPDQAPASAGGLYLQGVAIEIDDSTLANNVSRFAGGMFVGPGSTLTLSNSTIVGNVALSSLGGGVVLSDGTTGSISHCTFARNLAPGPVAFAAATVGGQGIVLESTIFSEHVVGNGFNPITCRDQMIDGGGNVQFPVVRDGGGSDDPGSLCAAGVLIGDALLGPLANHGGPTTTTVPATGGVAHALAVVCPASDQRGFARGEPCTSGAVELP